MSLFAGLFALALGHPFAEPSPCSGILPLKHNPPCTVEAMQADVDELVRLGYGGVACNCPFDGYVARESNWPPFVAYVKALKARGLRVWLYDERGYPSGFADGLTLDGHPELWTLGTWMKELKALREHLRLDRLHILGQSWGGMLIIAYLIEEKPSGICSAIISSGHASSSLWASEQHRMIGLMSPKDQQAIRRAEETGNFTDPEYLAANERFMELHCASTDENSPECLTRPKRAGKEAYLYGWGPNEYVPTGSLGDFEYIDRLGEISCPCLLFSGSEDLCTPAVARSMHEGIPGSRWELMEGARHMCFVDRHEDYCRILESWLEEYD